MAIVFKDRVRETSTTTGTGAFTLAGAVAGYQAFSAVCSVADTFWYAIVHSSTSWETGLGTYSSANTLTRTTVLESSNAGAAVNFAAGTKDVFIDFPASKAALLYDTTGAANRVRVDAAQSLTTPQMQQARDNILAAGSESTVNFIANPQFNIWQRGTSFAIPINTKTPVADRWKAYCTSANRTVSRQAGFSGAQYCLRLQRDNGISTTGSLRLWHQLHSSIGRALAGKTGTLSFDLRAGANYSGGVITVSAHSGSAGDEAADLSQNTTAFATGNVATTISSGTTPGALTRVSCTAVTLDATAVDVAFQFRYTPAGTAGAADYIEITNVKFEPGSTSTTFMPLKVSEEQTACLYTYQLIGTGLSGGSISTTDLQFGTVLPVPMRVAPTVTLLVTNPQVLGPTTTTASGSTISSSTSNVRGARFRLTGFSGLTADAGYILLTDSIVSLDAELV